MMRMELDILPVTIAGVSFKRFEIVTLPMESLSSSFSQIQNPETSVSGIRLRSIDSYSELLPRSF